MWDEPEKFVTRCAFVYQLFRRRRLLMRGSRIFAIIALVAAIAAVSLAIALKHQQTVRKAHIEKLRGQ